MVIPNLPLMAVHHGCPSSIMAVHQCGVANTRLLHRTEAVKRGQWTPYAKGTTSSIRELLAEEVSQ